MPTTAEYLTALNEAREALAQNITENGGTVLGEKFDQLAQDVTSITFGTRHFLTGSGMINPSEGVYPSRFEICTPFIPARITLHFPAVLTGTYSDSAAYTMIGTLTLPGILPNNGAPQYHTVSLDAGNRQRITTIVGTVISQTENGWKLTVLLPTAPTRFVFRGQYDWLCVDAAWEGDAE